MTVLAGIVVIAALAGLVTGLGPLPAYGLTIALLLALAYLLRPRSRG